jgi:hypothetical protein
MLTDVQMAWANRAKLIRAAIRLKHSLAADRELNVTLETHRKAFFAAVQRGKVLPPFDPAKILDA